jgi:hypothetical protein
MTRRGPLRIIALASLLAIALVALLAVSSYAADRDIFGNWIISGGNTTITDESIDVRGSVYVRYGGVLKLQNCTLALNGTANGDVRLEVWTTGAFEAYDSLIYGIRGRTRINFYGDVNIERSTLQHIHGTQNNRGVLCLDGVTTMRDTVIRDSTYYAMWIRTEVSLMNVTTMDITYSHIRITNSQAPRNVNVTLEDCNLMGNGPAQYDFGLYIVTTNDDPEIITLVVKNTHIERMAKGVHFNLEQNIKATFDNCEIFNNSEGVRIEAGRGDITFVNNVIGRREGTSSIGVIYLPGSGVTLTMEDNIVEWVGYGILYYSLTGGLYTASIGHNTLKNCREGFLARSRQSGRIDLTVHNCTLEVVSANFVARDRATIHVYDTTHQKLSGRVEGSGALIRAYTPIDIRRVIWQDGTQIKKGDLVMEDSNQREVLRLNISRLIKTHIVGWEVDDDGIRNYQYLYPSLYMGGHPFRGDKFDVWAPPSTEVEIVDDYSPEVSVTDPREMEGFNVTTILATGTYLELGSGMATMWYAFGDDNFTRFSSYHDGNWTLPLLDLDNGLFTLALYGTDVAGNVGNTSTVHFIIDTVRPLIAIPPPPELVNTTTITVAGRTEPNSTMTINNHGVAVLPDGTFSYDVPLKEGFNRVQIDVVDRQGNPNDTYFEVFRDTISPKLALTSPENATWINTRSIHVEGMTEPGVDLRVLGAEVHEINGTFKHRVGLSLGTFELRVSASDLAGNRVERSVILFVDWITPSLIIIEPESNEIYTREREVLISGDAEDAELPGDFVEPTIDRVMINDKTLELISGRFSERYTLPEGRLELNISVTDKAGNTNSTKIVIVRDLTPPEYEVTLIPLDGELVEVGGKTYSTGLAVEVHVTLSEVAIITLGDGSELQLTDDARIRIDIVEGTNEVWLRIKDLASNDAISYVWHIFKDSYPPAITIHEPQEGLRTKEGSVVVFGKTDEGSNVTVNGVPVPLLAGGEFRRVVPLDDGHNTITIEVADAMENKNATVVTVIKEKEPTVKEDSGTGLSGVVLFIVGLVVGFVIALGITTMRGRMAQEPEPEPEPEPQRPEKTPPSEPSKVLKEKRPPGGWEEF